ncbi:hypothetical protein [[Acholeplasma] multilocale]|uniref:hypothetical protein n=1 Tax=[Acholeplasma] multilocale TaxID=264638 RepID=UPI00047C1CB3|nr:hypothetical protein [[Acholeplasma] multilocale]
MKKNKVKFVIYRHGNKAKVRSFRIGKKTPEQLRRRLIRNNQFYNIDEDKIQLEYLNETFKDWKQKEWINDFKKMIN